ncbi:helix-turn-helix domain-containing protein [Rhizobium sp. RMa-01]|nr:hypothetical protein BBJ66_22755 [Rhizobium sp. RSm-3]RVU08387.1 helix-turn-helix domain-containing protein [Rhizobium sp. RMa-01]
MSKSAPGSKAAPFGLAKPLVCPCCNQQVTAPSLEIVVDHYGITALEAKILSAVWRGKGHAIPTERIFDAMYIDDPDGGPSPAKMYASFKVALCHLREKLESSGIGIENVGYRRGYRLVMAMRG